MHCLCWCTNSTGSSIVTMCPCRVWLMWLTIEASEVDLPEPVAPVTSTSPARMPQMRSHTARGRPSWSKFAMRFGIRRITAATEPCWWNTLARKRPLSARPNEQSSSSSRSSLAIWSLVSTLVASRRVSSGVSAGQSTGRSIPSTRMRGGEWIEMCKSEPPWRTKSDSSSSMVIMRALPPRTARARARWNLPRQSGQSSWWTFRPMRSGD